MPERGGFLSRNRNLPTSRHGLLPLLLWRRGLGRGGRLLVRFLFQWQCTPALSPSKGEREGLHLRRNRQRFPLSPFEGERAGVRGRRVIVRARCNVTTAAITVLLAGLAALTACTMNKQAPKSPPHAMQTPRQLKVKKSQASKLSYLLFPP